VNSKKFSKSSRIALHRSEDRAKELALAALTHLANDGEEMAKFLAETGFNPSDLRRTIAEPGFAGVMLDYLCSNESLLLAFASAHGIDPSEPETARQFLAAGDARDP
jgi:Protein of unknown function (DUF3572)